MTVKAARVLKAIASAEKAIERAKGLLEAASEEAPARGRKPRAEKAAAPAKKRAAKKGGRKAKAEATEKPARKAAAKKVARKGPKAAREVEAPVKKSKKTAKPEKTSKKRSSSSDEWPDA